MHKSLTLQTIARNKSAAKPAKLVIEKEEITKNGNEKEEALWLISPNHEVCDERKKEKASWVGLTWIFVTTMTERKEDDKEWKIGVEATAQKVIKR
jgi:hypothetical protein